MVMMGIRQILFVWCAASITGLSYLLCYTYIIIMCRFVGNISVYINASALVAWGCCVLLANSMHITFKTVRRDVLASVLLGIHTATFIGIVIGIVYVDQTKGEITQTLLIFSCMAHIIIMSSMEMFKVAIVRDWIIEVSDNDPELLVSSNTWYTILSVSIPAIMTGGGNYLFDFGLSVTGIILTLCATSILLQLLALTVIIFIISPLRSNIHIPEDEEGILQSLVNNVTYFFKRRLPWELSLGTCTENLGLISFGLFMRLFLAEKGVTPYTIGVLMFCQAGSAIISGVGFKVIRQKFNGGYVIQVCSIGKTIFAAIFLFVVLKEKYTNEIEEEVIIITHDAIFIELVDTHPEDNFILTAVIMISSVLLAGLSQIDTLMTNQIIQETVELEGRGRYAATESMFRFSFILAKQVFVASIQSNTIFVVLLVLTFVCELGKCGMVTKYMVKQGKGNLVGEEYDDADDIELEHKKLLR